MILEPNRGYAEPSAFDASGLRVHRIPNAPDAFRIYEVMPGTPAAEAGLHASDLLVALDDTAGAAHVPRHGAGGAHPRRT